MKKAVISTLIILITFLTLLASSRAEDKKIVIKPVVRLFMHQPGEYSLATVEEDTVLNIRKVSASSEMVWRKVLQTEHIISFETIKLVIDAKEGEPISAEFTVKPDVMVKGGFLGKDWWYTPVDVIIHIHSPKQVEGGEWEHVKKIRRQGKNQTHLYDTVVTQGNTVVIE